MSCLTEVLFNTICLTLGMHCQLMKLLQAVCVTQVKPYSHEWALLSQVKNILTADHSENKLSGRKLTVTWALRESVVYIFLLSLGME